MSLDFENNKFAILYDMYSRFRKTYYGQNNQETLLPIGAFIQVSPLVVIDCSYHNESVKSATVDVRLEFECRENVPPNTAYCLIIHDRVMQYNPLTNVVRKLL